MRAISTSALALLTLAALFWGNCLSCPQMLLAAKSAAAHGCCNKKGQKTPAKSQCDTQSLQNAEKADPSSPVAAVLSVTDHSQYVPVLQIADAVPTAALAPADPPFLHSIIRI